MPKLRATRWRRYGKDRLYVDAPDGSRVGWHDLVTGETHLEQVDLQAEFEQAIDKVLQTATRPDDAPAPVEDAGGGRDDVDSVSDESEAVEGGETGVWQDLAMRPAGAAARAQAQALKEAAPVRTALARLLRVRTDERAWRIGADGEEKVAGRLEKLAKKDARWRFLHAIPVGDNGSDIDHVVIGPAGVFTLNAKHHPRAQIWVGGDTLMVNGCRYPYVRNSRFEAKRASALLTKACGKRVTAVAVLVPVGADGITIKEPPSDVHVVNRMRLAEWLRSLPEVLDDQTVEEIFEVARRSTTWQVAGR